MARLDGVPARLAPRSLASEQICGFQRSKEAGMPTNRSADEYLSLLGVREVPPLTGPFDPGYDPVTLEGHLAQSSHLMSALKISMATWLIAREESVRRKVAAARTHGVPTVTGGGPFE